MAARPNPDEYNVPARWVPVSGELARGRCLMALSEIERLIFYNQDVLYHQNLEILQMLDELRGQHSDTSPKGIERRNNQTRTISEEAESKQTPIVEMPAPPVPSIRLPPVSNPEPLISLATPMSPGPPSTTNPTALIYPGSTPVTQSSPFTLARTNSLSGLAPMPSTLLNPQELPPIVKVPLSQKEWQEKFNGLVGSTDKQGKREAEDSDSEEEDGHSMGSNPVREEPFKRQKLEDASTSKDGNTVPGSLFKFSPSSKNSNTGSTDTSSLVPSSVVGFLARPSKSEANVFGTLTPFRSSESTATACKGTAFVAFETYTEKEGVGSGETNHYQSITCMPEYRGFSFQELRLADYAQGRRPAPVVTPEFSKQTKLGTASYGSISTLTTDGFGTVSKLNTEGSPFAKLIANSPPKPETRIFGGGPIRLPWWNSGTASGSGWPFDSTKTNTPSELREFSVARAAGGLQNQSPAQAPGFGFQSVDSLKPATSIFSKPSIPSTAAPIADTAFPSSTLQPRGAFSPVILSAEQLARGHFLIAKKCHPSDSNLDSRAFTRAWTALNGVKTGLIQKGNPKLFFAYENGLALEFGTREEVTEADGTKIPNGDGHYYLCKAFGHATESPGNEPQIVKEELPNTVKVKVMVAEPNRTPHVMLGNCAVSSYYKTQTTDTKRRLLIINNDNGELILDTALMKTVGFTRTLGGATAPIQRDVDI